ncbi:MAG: hypothetical protein N3A63_04200 [Bacteroidetes bacterium]|nr:hypothetical protein [Bacteroidota bacterium]
MFRIVPIHIPPDTIQPRAPFQTHEIFPTHGTSTDSLTTRYISGLGTLTSDTTSYITKNNILWSDRKTLDELLWHIPGFFVRTLGEVGAPTQLWAYGVSDSRITVFLDGRPLIDPVTETYNIAYIPTEFIDYTEVGIGKPTLGTSSDVYLNFVSRTFGTLKPRTKIRYVQEPNNSLHTDMMFTQNIFRSTNIMLALHRETSDGAYTNSGLDIWAGRAKLRYNVSPSLNISLLWMYHQLWRGINFGVQYPQSEDLYDAVRAQVLDDNAFEKHYRHDYSLNVLGYPTADTAVRTTLTLYATTLEREFRNPPSYTTDPNITLATKSHYEGYLLQQSIPLSFITGTVGYYRYHVGVDSTRTLPSLSETSTVLFGSLTANVYGLVTPTFAYRKEYKRTKKPETIAASLDFHPAPWLSLTLHRTWTDHLPTLLEMYWTDSLYIRSMPIKMEHHILTLVGITVRCYDELTLSLTAYQRTISQPLVYQTTLTSYGTPALHVFNKQKASVEGITARLHATFASFEFTATAHGSTYTENDTNKILTPTLTATGEFSYRQTFFNNALDMKLGIRSAFIDRENGMQYHPALNVFSESKTPILRRAILFDLFGIFNIGDAHVSISWTNITNRKYILTPMYPMPLSTVKLGVHWEFID